MTDPTIRPDTIARLRDQAELAFAMLAGMQLEVFSALEKGPLSLEAVAQALDVRPEKLQALMYALVAAGLLERQGERFANAAESAKFLVKGRPEYMGAVSGNLAFRWDAISKTAQSIRTGLPQAKQNFSEGDHDALEQFLRGIQVEAAKSGRELIENWDFTGVRTVADIGGGSGGLAMALTDSMPGLKATVIDLPNVIPIARKIIAEAGAGDRVSTSEADLLSGPLTGEYDVAVLRAVLQVLSPEDAARATMNVANAVTPGGSIHVIGRVIDDSRLSPISSVGFNLLALNIFDSGGAYTEGEYRNWLSAAGFEGVEVRPLGAGYTMVSARKPS